MNEGPKGFFAGYGSFLLRDLPFDALEFVLYEQLKKSYQATLNGRKIKSGETSVIGEPHSFFLKNESFLFRAEKHDDLLLPASACHEVCISPQITIATLATP